MCLSLVALRCVFIFSCMHLGSYLYLQTPDPSFYRGTSTSSLVLRSGRFSSNGQKHSVSPSRYYYSCRTYTRGDSPITFHRIFARKFVVLNTLKAANDLLESRSSVYSDRSVSWMYMELINRKLAVLNISSQNLRFKVYRRLIHTGLNPRAVERYNGILSRSCRPSSSCIGRR